MSELLESATNDPIYLPERQDETHAEAAGTGIPHERIALYDNIKGVLMLLVVFGHVAHPVHNSNPVLSACFDVIYLFHMPLFVFVSGLFAKGAYRDGKLNVNRIISFLVLGFAFQLALAYVNGARFTLARICAFTSAPWYLLAMAYWYALIPLLCALKARKGIALSVVISLLSGFVDFSDGFLAIGRAAAFLPYFALGYYLDLRSVPAARHTRAAYAAVFVAGLIVLARLCNANAYGWFFPLVYGDNPYQAGPVIGVLQRACTFCIAVICSLACLRLTPSRTNMLTTLGRRALQVYILHRLIRAWLTFHTPLYTFPFMDDPVAGTLVALALSFAIAACCTISVFERPLSRLLKIQWIGQRQGARRSGASG